MGGGGLFTGNIDLACTINLLIVMVVFACIFEAICDSVEHRLANNRGHSEMLSKVYKELMILGFIAFVVAMAQELGLHVSAADIKCFHFADMLLSCAVILYIMQCALSSFTMHVIRREWDRISMKSVERVTLTLDGFMKELQDSTWAKFKRLMPWTVLYKMRDEADFKVIQLIFKVQYHLKHNFDYVMYAKCVLEDVVVDLANISRYHWIAICLLCVVSNIARSLMDAAAADFSYSEFFSAPQEEDAVGAGSRRRLGGAGEADVDPCAGVFPALPCGLNASQVDQAFVSLVGNDSATNYSGSCAFCRAQAQIGEPKDASAEKIALAIVIYFLIGVLLLVLQGLINWTLGLRIQKVLTLTGAQDVYNCKELMREMQETLNQYEAADDLEAQASEQGTVAKTIQLDDDDEEEEQVQMLWFDVRGGNQKSSLDVMSPKLSKIIMWSTKLIMLLNCFYVAFYLAHTSQKVKQVDWMGRGSLREATCTVEPCPGRESDITDSMANFVIHILLLAPCVPLVVSMFPVTIRRLSLLIGVLYLNDRAVNDVLKHMEAVRTIRQRIMSQLLTCTFIKGSPKPKEGRRLLQVIENGEKQVLKQIMSMMSGDDDNESRITRQKMQSLMDEQHTHTTDKALNEFMKRSSYDKYLQESPEFQATSQTAKTLQYVKDSPKKTDTITVAEFQDFILRAVADVMNHACEHGVPRKEEVEPIKASIIDLATITADDFDNASRLARTKSLFKTVDTDDSNSITRAELNKAMKKYKIPVTVSEIDLILRILDPDQSGHVEMEEWLDFMLATENDLEKHTRNTEHKINAINGEKSLMHDVSAAASSLKDQTVGTVTGAVAGTVGAVGAVAGAVGVELPESVQGVASPTRQQAAAPTSPPRPGETVENPSADGGADPTAGNAEAAAAMIQPMPSTFEEEEEETGDAT